MAKSKSKARTKLIIDTDPGCDDILALLLAFASKPEDIEVLLISVTYGNVEAQSCLRNVMALFHVINRESEWRTQQGLPRGFEALHQASESPLVAVGANGPLAAQVVSADYFHGKDGLGGVHESHPHLSATSDAWSSLFVRSAMDDDPSTMTMSTDIPNAQSTQMAPSTALANVTAAHNAPIRAARDAYHDGLFRPSKLRAHKEILRILREEDPGTVSIVAIGPMTNIAAAAQEDADTLCRARELVVMGGALDVPGNITPLAEFNIHCDPLAAAQVFSLTSPTPASTWPVMPSKSGTNTTSIAEETSEVLQPSEPLKLALLPLDITTQHQLTRPLVQLALQSHTRIGQAVNTIRMEQGSDSLEKITSHTTSSTSPLAEWLSAILEPMLQRAERNPDPQGGGVGLSLHDPLALWYAITSPMPSGLESGSSTSPNDALAAAQSAFSGSEPPPVADLPPPSSSNTSWQIRENTDVRVETTGQWTRGATLIDKRSKAKAPRSGSVVAGGRKASTTAAHDTVNGDHGGWRAADKGNRISFVAQAPRLLHEGAGFAAVMLGRIFGVEPLG